MSRNPPAGRRPGRFASLAGVAILVCFAWCAAGVHAAVTKPAPPPADLKLPADIVYNRVVRADSAVYFSHETHVEYESYRCTGCHPKPYRLLTPTRRARHAEMDKGGSCGVCHDGKHAFDVRATETCRSCHAGRRPAPFVVGDSLGAAGAAAFSGPKPFVFKLGADSPGAVTFRHDTHRGKGSTCRACHPKPFSMKGTAPLPDGNMHAPSACGMCHDGKQSFSCEDDDKCEKCHVEGKGGK